MVGMSWMYVGGCVWGMFWVVNVVVVFGVLLIGNNLWNIVF